MIPALLAALALDTALIVAPGIWPPATFLFGPGHVLATLAALAAVRHGGRWRERGGWTLWLGGALGPAGVLAAYATLPLIARLPQRLMLPPAEPEDDAEPAPSLPIHAEHQPDPDQLGAFAPVFRHGSIADRQAAIETVVSVYEPRLSSVVALGLVDGDQTIRALAASASTRAGQLLFQRRRRLERAVALRGRVEDRLELAELLADFGENDALLSDTGRARLRTDAAEELDGAIALLPVTDPRRASAQAVLQRLRPGGDADRLPLSLALDTLLRARDAAGLARRCAMADALALAPDDPLHPVVAFWRDGIAA